MAHLDNHMIQSVSFMLLVAASYSAAAEVIASSSQSLLAVRASHTEPPLIHFIWAVQPSFASVCISDILAHTGLISEVAVASHFDKK